MLTAVIFFALKTRSALVTSAIAGAAAYFITNAFKQRAEKAEEKMLAGKGSTSAISKILYLEIIDATFSIDGVLGAFAFTLSVPLILIGNGIGAYILRRLTVGNIDRIKQYLYLKNGAMYSIFALGVVMLSDAFGATVPEWVSPLLTVAIVGYFFLKSRKVRIA